MTVTFSSVGPPTTEAEVAAFEAGLPNPLPPDYRAFLLRQNGGETQENWWPPEVGDADFGLATVYSLGDVAEYESLTQTRWAYDERMPERFLAVAGDANGNQLCLDLADGDDYGTVWFFDHELEVEPDEEPEPNLLTKVCDSFADLLDTLEPSPGLDEVVRRVNAARGFNIRL